MTAEQIALSTHPLYGAIIKEMDNSDSGSGFDASTGVLTLKFTTATSIEAGKPYIVKWEDTSGSVSDPEFTHVTISSTTPTGVASNDGKVTFLGTYSPTLLPKDVTTNLYMGAGSTLYYPNVENFYIRSFRAYFQLTPGTAVKGFVMEFDNDYADGIGTIQNSNFKIQNEEEPIYNLAGQRLQKMQKGINIVNGKKVLK